MRSPFIRLAAVLLSLVLGLSAHVVWERREQIIDACAELLMNYQD